MTVCKINLFVKMEMENRSDLIGIGINFCTGTFSGKI